MARVLATLIIGVLLGASMIAAPASALSQVSGSGPSSACVTVSLDGEVWVDPQECRRAFWGAFCFVVYTIAPYVYCHDPFQ